ncbi:reducing type I polyketide synthase [Glonium stellatum]|uniref:Reducing type I polyketide synthase n=1 Tax=Glonium stellatum TaxID=574774 RepID=A0A8E2EVX4_9PEZI|nr:reducing type I polyketide synthase [Glonium stellatum]
MAISNDSYSASSHANGYNGFSSHAVAHEMARNGCPEAEMPIAIIGMSCRFPGNVTSPEKLWKLCADGKSAWSEIPEDRFNKEAFYHPQSEKRTTGAKTNVIGGHFLTEDLSLFDAAFFNMTAEVASTMDPQCRLQLESVFEALESAGIPLEKIAGTETSVFAGAFFRDYMDSLMRDPDTFPRYVMTGNGATMMSNRISHFFDLRGPSMTVDTGCSTGLVALHQACQSLRTGDSKMSIVGGANVMINPDIFILMSSLNFLSPDGKSYAFDSRAAGYGRGEGVGTVILKPLRDALRDGDPVRAVIRQSALNQDGKTQTITSPSQKAQEELIRACYRAAGLRPSDTAYVEAHGTGTQAGDPVEAGAIGAVFGEGRSSEKPLFMGSVKTNVGHMETASGFASIIKVALALEKGFIPPSINFENPNEKIPLKKWKLKIPRRLEPWPSGSERRASINNFGYGGANAHVIMESSNYPWSYSTKAVNGFAANGSANNIMNAMCGRSRVFVLSAKDEAATRSMITNFSEYLRSSESQGEEELLNSLAYTLGERRSRFSWLVAVQGRTLQDLSIALEDSTLNLSRSVETPRLGFVFTGQGAQWYGMGRELIEAYPIFEDSLREADRILKGLGAPWSLIDELTKDEENSSVNDIVLSPPLCIAVQISLVRLLRSWGINPTAVTSHSSGEVAAAYAAGAVDFQEAMAIVYARGAYLAALQENVYHRGGMIAVGLGREDAEVLISEISSGDVVVACVNSPSSVTVSGDILGIKELEMKLVAKKIFSRILKVPIAYHSHHMAPLKGDYLRTLRKNLTQGGDFGDIIYTSPVTGGRIHDAAEITPEHWVRNMLQPVLFVDSLRAMCIGESLGNSPDKKQIDVLVEVGPHSALAGPIRQSLMLPELKGMEISYGSCLVRGKNAVETMQTLACSLVRKGYPVKLAAVNFPHEMRRPRVLHDLPPYPWTHQVRHWKESRLNKAHRQRKYPNHDLIGSPLTGANPLEPTWRHIIRPSEVPWVHDHLVQSDIIYPGAGLISMAIEATRQIAQSSNKTILGYRLREIEIMKALLIPNTLEGVEVQLRLRKCSERMLGMKEWQEFCVYSTDGDGTWTEHCNGLIYVQFTSTSDVATSWHDSPVEPSLKSRFDTNRGAYTKLVEPGDIFKFFQSVGIHHGPTFQNLTEIKFSEGRSVTSFNVADTASVMPEGYEHEHLLHPTTLDSIFQAAYSTLTGAGFSQMTAMVPRSINKMFVSESINRNAGHRMQAYSTLHRHSSQGFQASVVANSENGPECSPVLEINGLYCQSLGATPANEGADAPNTCLTVHWEHDLSFMQPKDLNEMLKFPPNPSEIVIVADMKRACFHFFYDALESLTEADVEKLSWYHKSFYNWMRLQVEKEPRRSDWSHSSEEEKILLFGAVSKASIDGQMVCRVGSNLVSILRQKKAPLELMLEDQLLYTYYKEALRIDRSYVQVKKLIKLFAHQNPQAKILEIGAGTGGCTQGVLDVLGGGDTDSIPHFAHYDFTDVSSGFFEKARERFGPWGDLISYKKLNIETDPEAQGFENGAYDLIVACQVLHATKAMEITMANVRKLLKPGGKLIMVETTHDVLDIQLIFGVLPGWWLSEEEERKLSPSLSIDLWDRILRRTGFSGLDVNVQDCEDQNYVMSVLMSTANFESPPDFHPDVVISYSGPQPPESWLNDLKNSIEAATSYTPAIESLDSVHAHGKVCIFLDDATQPILAQPSAAQFRSLKQLLTGAKGVLWVSCGGAIDCQLPESGLHTGLLRTLRCEDNMKRYISLDSDVRHKPWSVDRALAVLNVYTTAFNYARDKGSIDFEYAARGRSISIPRIYEDLDESKAVAVETANSGPEVQPFHQPGRQLRMGVGIPGMLDSLFFQDDPEATEPLPNDFVEIEPKAFGLNFRDVMVAMGQLDETIMGFECSGIITRVGSNVSSGLKVGDRVCSLLRGHWAGLVRVHWTSVSRIPDDMTFETAASIPVVFVTAYYSLYDIARLQKTETVLIHSAAGGVGQAAIMLAQLTGAEVFATVGSKEKKDFVAETYGIASDHIFSSRDPSFAPKIMAMTNGKGVDVVLNSLAGQLLQETWNCIARFGRFVEIGKRDLEQNKNLEMSPFTRSVTFAAVDLILLGNFKGEIVARALGNVMNLLKEKSIQAVTPTTIYSVSEVEKAFRLMQAGKHLGKVVVKPNFGDSVKVQQRVIKLLPQASYLVVGGTGGIGRSIARRMVERGAKHLILLSRSAEADSNIAFLNELEAAGSKVLARNCDVADKSGLAQVMSECAKKMPPVRGVIQGAMVLQDSILEHMSFEDYNTAIRPKVQGTWNLHHQFLGPDLDFFVMLSSMTGIGGNSSQANYAAGGTFQDAMARYRTAKGLPAVSLDLGMVKSVGYVAETKGVADRLTRQGYRLIEEDEVLRLIEAAILNPIRQCHSSQIITGICTGVGADWGDAPWRDDLRFSSLRQVHSSRTDSGGSNNGTVDLKSQLTGALAWIDAVDFICNAIVKKLSEMFAIPEAEINKSAPMSRYGVDSLVAVELRNWLASSAQGETSIFDVMQSPSLTALATSVALKSRFVDLGLHPTK